MVVRRYAMNVKLNNFEALSGEPTTTLAFRSSYLHSGSAVINSTGDMGSASKVGIGSVKKLVSPKSPYNMEAVSSYLISLQSLKVDTSPAFRDSIRKVKNSREGQDFSGW
jgi:hypothetical protein